jgi:hypothetical protein
MLFFDLQNYNKISHGFRYIYACNSVAYIVLIYVKASIHVSSKNCIIKV